MGFLLLSLCFLALLFVRFYVDHPVTGDEPHYLLMDYSLVHDHDFNLKNNYQHQDYRQFYPGPLTPKGQVSTQQYNDDSPKFYSIHGIGIPVLVLPGYIIAKQTGVAVEMTLLATGVVWLTWLWALKLTKNNKLSMLTAAFLAGCLFFNSLAGYIYPDLIIAGITIASLLIALFYFERPRYQLLFGLLLGIMVFVHFKTMTLAGPLFCILLYKLWRKQHRLPWPTIIIGVAFLAAFFLTLHSWYGLWNPAHIYSSDISLKASPLHTIPAMLFDSARGFLVFNPVLLLIFVGLAPWFKQRREALIAAVLVVAPSIFLLSTFNLWNGGYAPTGRYVMDFVPIFMPAAAFALSVLRARWQQSIIVLLAVVTLFVTVASASLKPSYLDPGAYRSRSALFAGIEKHTNIGFDRLLPSYSKDTTLDDRRGNLKVALGMFMLLSLAVYGYYLSRPLKPIKQ